MGTAAENRKYYREGGGKAKVMARNRANQQRNRDYVDAIRALGCIDCPPELEWPVECIDFDHLPGTVKFKVVAQMVIDGHSIARIQEEIDKCDRVCANHHRIRTMQRLRGNG